MKLLSKNQKIFALVALVLSNTFFYFLYKFIESERFNYVIVCSSLFGTALLLSGFTLGYRDKAISEKLPLGFGYHLITYIVVNVIGIIALLVFLGLSSQSVLTTLSTLFFWGLGLGAHYYFRRRNNNLFDSDRVFD